MITSACVIPIASDEGSDAAGNDTSIANGETYGIYVDLNNKSINRLVGDIEDSISDDRHSKAFFKRLLEIAGIELKNLDYDVDMDLGLAITKVSSNANGNTYRVSCIAGGHFNYVATMDDSVENYVGKVSADVVDIESYIANKDILMEFTTMEETRDVDFDIQFGLDLMVDTDKDGAITGINGIMGRELNYVISKTTLEELNDRGFLLESIQKHHSSAYMEFDRISGKDEALVNVTWFLAGDIEYLDKLIGPYGNTVMNIDEMDIILPIDAIEEFLIASNEQIDDSGNIGMEGFLNIIGCIPVKESIGSMILATVGGFLGVELETPESDGGRLTVNDYIVTPLKTYIDDASSGMWDWIVLLLDEELDVDVDFETLGDIYRILYTDNICKKISNSEYLVSVLETITGDTVTGMLSTISELIDFAKSYYNIDAIPNFIFGDRGFKLTDKEVKAINNSAVSLANKSINGLKDKDFTVKFYDSIDGDVISTKSVKFGSGVTKDSAITSVEDAAGKYFLGWFAFVDGEFFPQSTDLTRIYGNLDLAPVFADMVDDFDAIRDAADGSEVYASISDEIIDANGLVGKKVHIGVSSDSIVRFLVWNFSGDYENSDGSALGNVNLKYTAQITEEDSIRLSFSHEGALPAGTYVTVDISGIYEKGTVLNVYHVVDGVKVLVDGMAIINENGEINFAIDHCSSYILEINEHLTYFEAAEDDDDVDEKNVNLVLLGGIAGCALLIVVLGALFFFKRR